MKKISFRRKSNRRKARGKPINVVASALTTAGLYCGIASMFKAIGQDFKWAAYFIILAQVFDILDGTFAKLTNTTSEFGKQLDSLADLASFGVAPAILIFTAFLHENAETGIMGSKLGSTIAIIYVICAALRLARFNVYQSAIRDFFVGLPTPAAAVTVATFVMFTHHFELKVAYWVLSPLTLGLAYLMVSNLRYPKDILKKKALAPRNAFRILVLCGLAIAVFHMASDGHSPAIVLFPLCAFYVLFGIVDKIYFVFLRRGRLRGAARPLAAAPEDLACAEGASPAKTGEDL